MKIFEEKVKKALDNSMGGGITQYFEENYPYHIKAGELRAFISHSESGEIEERLVGQNLVVNTASFLVAQHMKGDELSSGARPGVISMALGLGGPGWDPLSPPQPDPEDTSLEVEVVRRPVINTQYVTSDGQPAASVTNIVDFFINFERGSVAFAIMEAGLFGGENADAEGGSGQFMVSKRNFPVQHFDINTAIMYIWRLYF